MARGMTKEAIERVMKKYGGTLLKDTNPELFQAELSAGPSTVFLSRTSPMAPAKDSVLDSTEELTPSTEQDATLLLAMKNHPGLTYEEAKEMAKDFGF